MELFECVDLVIIAWTVDAVELLVSNLEAVASAVAVVVVALAAWSIAFVRRGVPRVLVRLHDVELWAPLAVDLVGVAVEVAALAAAWVASLVLAWHGDEVESGVAAASELREVNIIRDGATEKVDAIEVVFFKRVARGEVASATVWDLHPVTALWRVPVWTDDVECLW